MNQRKEFQEFRFKTDSYQFVKHSSLKRTNQAQRRHFFFLDRQALRSLDFLALKTLQLFRFTRQENTKSI